VSGKKDVNWSRWARYYVGRALELLGLLLVTWAMLLFFGGEMRPLLTLTGAGVTLFFVGWLLARKNPEGRE
jgi:hypothetical protein